MRVTFCSERVSPTASAVAEMQTPISGAHRYSHPAMASQTDSSVAAINGSIGSRSNESERTGAGHDRASSSTSSIVGGHPPAADRCVAMLDCSDYSVSFDL